MRFSWNGEQVLLSVKDCDKQIEIILASFNDIYEMLGLLADAKRKVCFDGVRYFNRKWCRLQNTFIVKCRRLPAVPEDLIYGSSNYLRSWIYVRLHLFAPLSARVSSALGNVCFAVDDEY